MDYNTQPPMLPSPPSSSSFKHSMKELFKQLYVEFPMYFTLACYGVFSLLIGLDVWRAYNKRAIWLPGKAFALTGVTVQILAWWTIATHVSLRHMFDEHQVIVSARVAVCVFVGYLMPEMSAPSVRTFVTFAITICAQIASELVTLLFDEQQLAIADLVVFICVIVLALILCSTILASSTIHGLLSQRVSAISSVIEEDERNKSITWNDFEDEVLRSWFVARVCQVDYVICRSVFSSAVGVVVTISVIACVLSQFVSNTLYNEYFDQGPYPDEDDIAIIVLLFGFIVIGWVVICWRWLAAQFYFDQHKYNWRKCLYVEHFWTSNIVDLIHMYDLKRDRHQFQRSISKMSWFSKLQSFRIRVFTKIRLHKLLHLVLMLQVIIVFFSKVCRLVSEVIVGIFVHRCRKHMRKRAPIESATKYARILRCLCMQGENPSDLWEANHMSFKKAKLLMENGCEKGTSSAEINSFFCPYSLQWAEDGMLLLNKLRNMAPPSVLSHFPRVETQCVKIIVVSLITIFIQLHKAESDHLNKIVKACGEVWDFLTFVDECDIDLQATEIVLIDDFNKDKDQVCMAADREFYKLQMGHNRLFFGCENTNRFLEDVSSKCEGLLIRENLLGDYKEEVDTDLSDSKDWTKIAQSYTLYKLCKLMLDENIENFMKWTEESLRNVIAYSMSRFPDMLAKQCWKWAQEFEEDKLWEALHLTGKCKGMMKEWGLKPTLNITKQWGIEETMSTGSLSDL